MHRHARPPLLIGMLDDASVEGSLLELSRLTCDPILQLSVIQFSGRTQVEIPLQRPDKVDCPSIMKRVVSMCGN